MNQTIVSDVQFDSAYWITPLSLFKPPWHTCGWKQRNGAKGGILFFLAPFLKE